MMKSKFWLLEIAAAVCVVVIAAVILRAMSDDRKNEEMTAGEENSAEQSENAADYSSNYPTTEQTEAILPANTTFIANLIHL